MEPTTRNDGQFDEANGLSPEEQEKLDRLEIAEFHKTLDPLYEIIVERFFEVRRKHGEIPLKKQLEYIVKLGGETEISTQAWQFALIHFVPILKALNSTNWVDISLKAFSEPPTLSSLLSLNRFMVFGLDLKITPEQEVKLIEINGLNSGMVGFAKNRLNVETEKGVLRADKAVQNHIEAYGRSEIAFIGSVLAAEGTQAWRLSSSEELAKLLLRGGRPFLKDKLTGSVHEAWINEILPIAKNLDAMEGLLGNKALMDLFYSDIRDVKPVSRRLSNSSIQEIFEEHNCEYVLIKPTDGSIGRDVRIVSKEDSLKIDFSDDISTIVEPFIPSTPIYCRETNDMHDGCMRYVVIAEENREGVLKLHHFGGYWRLSPSPISKYGNLEAMRANLHQRAKLEVLTDADLELVRKTADRVLTSIWPKFQNSGEILYNGLFGLELNFD